MYLAFYERRLADVANQRRDAHAASNSAGNEEDAAIGVDEGISDNDDVDEEDPLDDDGDDEINGDANNSRQLHAV